MNNCCKRWLAAVMLLSAAFLLSGCVSQMQERSAQDLSAVEITAQMPAPQADGYAARTETVMLYFLDEEATQLIPVARSLQVEGGMTTPEAALRALLAGPVEGERAFWPEIGALQSTRCYELSGGVATVDLPARMRMQTTEMLYAVRMAIAQTLTEFSEVSYVNVLIGGREEGFDLAASMPVGALSRSEDLDVASRYLRLDELRQSAQESGLTRMTTLYFPSADGRYILPQVRSVSYAEIAPIEYLYTILEALGAGSDDPLCMDPPAPMKYIEEMPEIARTEDGAYRAIDIRFSASLDDALQASGLSRAVYLAMLTDTLMGFVPGVDGLQIRIDGELVEEVTDGQGNAIAFDQALITRGAFSGFIGTPVTLYVPDAQGKKLTRVSSVIAQICAGDARERLALLFERGMPDSSLTREDVLAVHVGEDCMAVNLSGNVRSVMEGMTAQQERAAVYAMVNTLTEKMDAEQIVFFFEGEQVASLAGGLEMRGAFLRNPGMVSEE